MTCVIGNDGLILAIREHLEKVDKAGEGRVNFRAVSKDGKTYCIQFMEKEDTCSNDLETMLK